MDAGASGDATPAAAATHETANATFTTTNLGALTTEFIAADSCTSTTLSDAGIAAQTRPSQDAPDAGDITISGTYFIFTQARTCGPDGTPRADEACFPPRYADAWDSMYRQEPAMTVFPVYSPATICPSGYRGGCTFANPVPRTWLGDDLSSVTTAQSHLTTIRGSNRETITTTTVATTVTVALTDAFANAASFLLKTGEIAVACCPR
ncbi:hypothetical protein IF1G_07478 [Cordyceps javanica]|uniref:Uncharacterized protein n=1 Tax=Cordyceps javanica TaxID=43265 RepID=A0A545VS44_9HYPO|nr:hypothetical protein IF1G_07478 [Cordyceps javanica]TQW04529.1 hypothetical protein IF2G_07758 [Cordyceps javanica]